MFLKKNPEDKKFKEQYEKFDIDKQDFWLLVKSAYKVILPFAFLIVFIYFLFTLFLTKVILK